MNAPGPTIEIASKPSVTRHDFRSFRPVILCPSSGLSSRAGWTPERAEECRVSPMLRTRGRFVAGWWQVGGSPRLSGPAIVFEGFLLQKVLGYVSPLSGARRVQY